MRSYIDEIEIGVDRHLHRFPERLDADLFAFSAYQTDFLRPDFLIDLMILANNVPPPLMEKGRRCNLGNQIRSLKKQIKNAGIIARIPLANVSWPPAASKLARSDRVRRLR
ncbi:hypothetical protein [Cohnella sp. 56]|uniref:hypothetical protein n=1 Tax=Cohnella sp. 56 TaxID=3113722 RepID=UPI0030E90BC5